MTSKTMIRQCKKCGNRYPATTEYFHRRKLGKNGLRSVCKKCRNEYSKEYKKKNCKKLKEDNKKYRYRPEVKVRLSEQQRTRRLKFYGLTSKQHLLMYADQNGCCAICNKAVPYSEIVVDHDHETGKVRELLCTRCNITLGLIENDLDLVDIMTGYLVKHED